MVCDKYEAGGGQVSEQTRIEWVQQKISAASGMAMQEHKRLLKSLGKLDLELETDWFKYSDELIMVCSDLPAAPAAPAAPTAPAQVLYQQVNCHRGLQEADS